MYEKSADVVKKNLIFRPMLPNNDDILFSGKVTVFTADDIPNDLAFENAHLTCFAGGMFALGAKIFNREDDLEIAKKLTEGCVWSYNSTSTGIMPESFFVVGCEDQKSCTWNQTKYYESLDPHAEYRLNTYKEQMESYEEQLAEASSSYAEAMMAATGAPQAKASGLVEKAVESEPLPAEAEPTEEPIAVGVGKRQLDPADEPAEKPSKTNKKTDGEPLMEKRPMTEKFPVLEDSNDEESEERAAPAKTENPPSPTLPTFPNIYSPRAPLSHEEYVQNRIQEERLPEGVTNIQSKHYILRYVSYTLPYPTPSPRKNLPLTYLAPQPRSH
jgi:mannosyl-oligosaccharide alpha-1,2-mannosidase